MASASGLILLAETERDSTRTSTYGTGKLISHAIDNGAEHILLGIGGSAAADGGCGMAQALGTHFIMPEGRLINEQIIGGMLETVDRIDVSRLNECLRGVTITVACDVTNPLAGPNGAVHIYDPQKGATPPQAAQLDSGLCLLAALWRG